MDNYKITVIREMKFILNVYYVFVFQANKVKNW